MARRRTQGEESCCAVNATGSPRFRNKPPNSSGIDERICVFSAANYALLAFLDGTGTTQGRLSRLYDRVILESK
jgi:hypothetical protein